jgi:hypothetical protein
MFKEIKGRDAWSTLRGFVYQVDVTILRWLNLGDNEVLELEKGEDIDIVNLDFNDTEISRELEQIKHTESTYSLNQENVINIFFNFYFHKKNNPKLKLLFRFVSNIGYNTERPEIFRDGKKGIELWIELFNLCSILKTDDRYLAIKKHLLQKVSAKLQDLSKLTSDDGKLIHSQWSDFFNYIVDDNNLIGFIKSFEWSLSNDNDVIISNTIIDTIVGRKLIFPDLNPEILYARLFLFVFKLMTKKGLKSLNSDELRIQTTLIVLNGNDQVIIDFINYFLRNADERLNELEDRVGINLTQILELNSSVELLKNSDTVFEFRLSNLSITPVETIKNASLREKKVKDITQLFNKYSWINFQGINGTGKTQLASLIYKKFDNHFWLELSAHNQDNEKTALLIETFLSQISGVAIINERISWIKAVINAIPENTLIIFNDLPNIERNTQLKELLVLFSNNISGSGIKILTTSNKNISNFIIQSLDNDFFNEYYDFNFDEEEIIECLFNNNANTEVLKYVNLIAIISEGNPQLINAIIYNLKSINWGKDSSELFEVLLKKEFASEILNDSQKTIKKFITDEKSKELLYRLSLIPWDFKMQEVISVCEVSEKILHPNDKLQDLVNIWIQENKDSYQISPLIYNIGVNNLSVEVFENVHIALAKSIISTKILNQISAYNSISSFIKGKDFNNAGIVLLKVYFSAKTEEEAKYLSDWGYLSYWIENDIPQEMNMILKSYIRCEQIRLFKLLSKEKTILLDSLVIYSKEPYLSISDTVIIKVFILTNSTTNDNLSLYWYHLEFIFDNYIKLDKSFNEIFNIDFISGLLWFPVTKLVSQQDISQWLKFIEQLGKKSRDDFFSSEYAQSALKIISDKIVNSQHSIPIEERNWKIIVVQLDFLISYFEKNKYDILLATVLSERVALEFQIFKNPIRAEESVIKLSKELNSDLAKYILFDVIGKLFYYEKNLPKSTLWLLKALDFNCTSQSGFVDTLIYASSSISNENKEMALEFCIKANELANLNEELPELDYLQITGELAIAYWLNGNNNESFLTFESIVDRLFKINEENRDTNWTRLFMLLGHSLGYIAASVAKDKLPETVSDGSDYKKPNQGIFTFGDRDLSDLYKSKNNPLIFAHLAIFAEGLNNIEKAYIWSLKAFDLARRNGDDQIILMLSAICGQYSLINFKLTEAFETSLLFSAVSSHLTGTPINRQTNLKEMNISDFLSIKPSLNWNAAESTTVTFTIIPLFIMVLTGKLENEIGNQKKSVEYIEMLQNYISDASDVKLWESVLSICNQIINNTISISDLIAMADSYSDEESKNLKLLCLIGVIFNSKDNMVILSQILNIFPYFTKVFTSVKGVLKFALLPFLKNRLFKILKDSYVGTKQELEELNLKVENIDISDNNVVQKMLHFVIPEVEIVVQEDRKAWLYEYEII